jgi:hypothetical protein
MQVLALLRSLRGPSGPLLLQQNRLHLPHLFTNASLPWPAIQLQRSRACHACRDRQYTRPRPGSEGESTLPSQWIHVPTYVLPELKELAKAPPLVNADWKDAVYKASSSESLGSPRPHAVVPLLAACEDQAGVLKAAVSLAQGGEGGGRGAFDVQSR